MLLVQTAALPSDVLDPMQHTSMWSVRDQDAYGERVRNIIGRAPIDEPFHSAIVSSAWTSRWRILRFLFDQTHTKGVSESTVLPSGSWMNRWVPQSTMPKGNCYFTNIAGSLKENPQALYSGWLHLCSFMEQAKQQQPDEMGNKGRRVAIFSSRITLIYF